MLYLNRQKYEGKKIEEKNPNFFNKRVSKNK